MPKNTLDDYIDCIINILQLPVREWVLREYYIEFAHYFVPVHIQEKSPYHFAANLRFFVRPLLDQ